MPRKNTPDFIGIGSSRSGTTWIFECLIRHPQISGSSIKEINLLNKKGDFDLDEYLGYFKHCTPQKVKGEYSSEYLYSEIAAQRIKKHFPNARLIICLRKPIERAISHYYFKRSWEDSVLPTLEEQLIKDPRNEVYHSRYYEHIQMYLKYFKREQMLIVLLDDNKEDPRAFIQKIYRFLGVSDNFIPDALYKNYKVTAENKMHLPYLKRTLFTMRKILKQRKAGRCVVRILKVFKINVVVKYIVERNMRQDNDKSIKLLQKETISESAYNKLKELYEPEIKKLEQLIGRSLPEDWLYYPTHSDDYKPKA